MGMFDNFNIIEESPENISNQKYNPKTLHPEIIVTASPYMDDNQNIVWNYGDTIGIDFEIEGMLKGEDKINANNIWEPIEDFLDDKKITIELLNHRNDYIFKKETSTNNNIITFSLNSKESEKIIRGTYTLNIKINHLDEFDMDLTKNLLTINKKIIVK